uniref:Ankyrin repeat protein n=1 Tax=viral metagenome TaxID=1070528 RepID=A0A6C0JU15_9ZZZZ
MDNARLLELVKWNDVEEIRKLLLENDKPCSIYPLIYAIENRDNKTSSVSHDTIMMLFEDRRYSTDQILDGSLLLAIEKQNIDLIRYLLDKITNLDPYSIIEAVKTRNINIVEIFVGDPRISDDFLYLCADKASELGDLEMLQYFDSYWTSVTASNAKNSEVLEKLAEKPVPFYWNCVERVVRYHTEDDIEASIRVLVEKRGYTLEEIMTMACSKGRIKVVKYLFHTFGIVPSREDVLFCLEAGYDRVSRQLYNLICEDLHRLKQVLVANGV